MYKGKTYYVCCTGCKQAFEDDPEGIIAAAEERIRKARESLGN
ncbi:MAG: YHS domain-containing protein [Planctomycetaceae bacterium]|nr:YHS domain-containing protein [Planctomycetaceae bacterium]